MADLQSLYFQIEQLSFNKSWLYVHNTSHQSISTEYLSLMKLKIFHVFKELSSVSCTSSHFHLVAANILVLKLLSDISLLLSFHSISVFLCLPNLAPAKRTKAYTQPCDWTKSSTSPLSSTPPWSVKITPHILGNVECNQKSPLSAAVFHVYDLMVSQLSHQSVSRQ